MQRGSRQLSARSRRVVASAAALTLLGSALGLAPSSAASAAVAPRSPWTTQTLSWSTPGPSDPTANAVSCPTATSCVAVIDGTGVPHIATLSGGAWTLAPAPIAPNDGGTLDGVSCLSSTSCVAVGEQASSETIAHPLIETLASGTWTPTILPVPSGATAPQLTSVDCTSTTSCVAVGTETVSATGDPFGDSDTLPFAEVLAGTSWTEATLPTPQDSTQPALSGLACATSTTCVAVGTYLDDNQISWAFADTLTSGTWSSTKLPLLAGWQSTQTGGVACPTATDCIAVGASSDPNGDVSSFASTWNGATWTSANVANPATGTEPGLNAISCTATTSCVAVGSDFPSENAAENGVNAEVLIETLSGTTWTGVSLPATQGNLEPSMTDVVCTATTACTAVGVLSEESNSAYEQQGYGTYEAKVESYGESHVLVETLSGAAWTKSLLADPPGPPDARLLSVSCGHPADCEAVGIVETAADTEKALVASEVDATWTMATLPLPAGMNGADLSSVSCARVDECVAVGNEATAHHDFLLVAQLVGRTWTQRRLPDPVGFRDAEFYKISCGTPTFCVAIGEGGTGADGEEASFVDVWQSGAWRPSAKPPKGVKLLAIEDISCRSLWCEGLGFSTAGREAALTLSRGSWTSEVFKAPFRKSRLEMTSISCARAEECYASGLVTKGEADGVLAEVLAGTTWTPRLLSRMSSSNAAYPDTISCATTTFCGVVLETFNFSNILSGVSPIVGVVRTVSGRSLSSSVLPLPAHTLFGEFTSISCASPGGCTTAGEAEFLDGTVLAIVARGR